jgi:hypothetical protein
MVYFAAKYYNGEGDILMSNKEMKTVNDIVFDDGVGNAKTLKEINNNPRFQVDEMKDRVITKLSVVPEDIKMRGATAPYQFNVLKDGTTVESMGKNIISINGEKIEHRELQPNEMLDAVLGTDINPNLSEKPINYDEVDGEFKEVVDKFSKDIINGLANDIIEEPPIFALEDKKEKPNPIDGMTLPLRTNVLLNNSHEEATNEELQKEKTELYEVKKKSRIPEKEFSKLCKELNYDWGKIKAEIEARGYAPEDDEEEMDQEKEKPQPMNVFERETLLKSEEGKKKVEEDKIYDDIQNMSDEELRKSVDEETTDIKEGTGMAPEPYSIEQDAHTVNNLMLNDLSDEEAMQIYNLAVKMKADPSFNVVAELPKRLYDNITLHCKALGITGIKTINNFAKMLLQQLVDEMALDKECKVFQDELQQALAFPEIVDMYSEDFRKRMEETIPKQMETETNEELKKEMLGVSKAYSESYIFNRQLHLLLDDTFVLKLDKKIRRFERSCDNFDFTMSKSILKPPIKCKDLLKELPYAVKVDEWQCKAFIVLLAEVCKDIHPTDKPGIWFMYCSIRNIYSLARTGNTKTEFSKECIDHLKALFKVIEKRYTDLHKA